MAKKAAKKKVTKKAATKKKAIKKTTGLGSQKTQEAAPASGSGLAARRNRNTGATGTPSATRRFMGGGGRGGGNSAIDILKPRWAMGGECYDFALKSGEGAEVIILQGPICQLAYPISYRKLNGNNGPYALREWITTDGVEVDDEGHTRAVKPCRLVAAMGEPWRVSVFLIADLRGTSQRERDRKIVHDVAVRKLIVPSGPLATQILELEETPQINGDFINFQVKIRRSSDRNSRRIGESMVAIERVDASLVAGDSDVQEQLQKFDLEGFLAPFSDEDQIALLRQHKRISDDIGGDRRGYEEGISIALDPSASADEVMEAMLRYSEILGEAGASPSKSKSGLQAKGDDNSGDALTDLDDVEGADPGTSDDEFDDGLEEDTEAVGEDLVGYRVTKDFDGTPYPGEIASYDEDADKYGVQFDDGDSGDFVYDDLTFLEEDEGEGGAASDDDVWDEG